MKVIFFTILTIVLATNSVIAQKRTRKKTPAQINKVFFKQTNPADTENKNESKQFVRQSDSTISEMPLKILFKPRAAYPNQDKGSVCIQGTVRLRVTFLETGKIGETVIISGLTYGANENAVEAAKKIKFAPATKDGKPITSVKVMQFSFMIY